MDNEKRQLQELVQAANEVMTKQERDMADLKEKNRTLSYQMLFLMFMVASLLVVIYTLL